MPITLYGETERHYQKRVFFLLFLRVLSTKRLKCIERALFWNAEEHYQEKVYYFVFLSILRTKIIERIQNNQYMEKK